MSPVRRIKTKIGELLLHKGLISQEHLKHALELQSNQKKDKPLGQILIELGYINKEELGAVLAVQLGHPYISINDCSIEPEVLALIAVAMAKKYQVFPLDKIQDVLTVAMVNPLDKFAISQIQNLTKTEVRVFLTTPLELEEMISKYYGE